MVLRYLSYMNIIIVGAAEIGRHLAHSLSQEAHSISVVEDDAIIGEIALGTRGRGFGVEHPHDV